MIARFLEIFDSPTNCHGTGYTEEFIPPILQTSVMQRWNEHQQVTTIIVCTAHKRITSSWTYKVLLFQRSEDFTWDYSSLAIYILSCKEKGTCSYALSWWQTNNWTILCKRLFIRSSRGWKQYFPTCPLPVPIFMTKGASLWLTEISLALI